MRAESEILDLGCGTELEKEDFDGNTKSHMYFEMKIQCNFFVGRVKRAQPSLPIHALFIKKESYLLLQFNIHKRMII